MYWRRKLEEEMEEELGAELEEEPGIPDLKNVVPCSTIMPTLQTQEAQCYQTLRLCTPESAGRAVSVATAEPRAHVKVRPNVRPNVRPKVRPKVEPKVKPSHVKSSKLLFVLFNFFNFQLFYLLRPYWYGNLLVNNI